MGAVKAVSKVSAAGHNVLLIIQTVVNGSGDDANRGKGLVEGHNAFFCFFFQKRETKTRRNRE